MIDAARDGYMVDTNGATLRHTMAFVALALLLSSSVLQFASEPDRLMPASISQEEDTGSISVTVCDNAGRAIGDAVVTIVELGLTNRTNLTGRVLFTHLPVDPNSTEGTEYSLYASKTGYLQSEVTAVVVTIGNVSEAVLEIFGGTVFGEVRDAFGPIRGAVVSIPTLGYNNTSGIDGDYIIRGVPGTFSYAVIASAVGYLNQTEEVVLEIGGFALVSFVLESLTGSISGAVHHSVTSEPLSGAEVSVFTGTVTVTVTTDGNGSYRIPNLQSGTYDVDVDLDGFEPASRTGVTVVSGNDTDGIDFLLSEKPTKLYGVVKAGTILLPGVLITIVDAGIFANTSIDGEYEITNITAGTYEVVASLEGYDDANYIVVIPRGGEVQLNINLQGLPGSLFGMVISSQTKTPLSGVEVMITSLGTLGIERTTLTNTQGVFEFAGLSGGNYTIRFRLDGFKPKEIRPVVVTQNASSTLNEILLEPVSEGLGGFIFGFDLAHSMMILALFLTIIILALAVLLRIRAFESPDKAPAIYDEEEPFEEEKEDEEDRAEVEPPRQEPKKGKKKSKKGKG